MTRLKPVLLCLMLLALALGLTPTYAQVSGFEAWLYEPLAGQMIRINETGEISRLTLPLPAGFDTYPYGGVAVSPDGATIAYIAGKNASFEAELVIYSVRTNSVLATYPPSGSSYTSFDFSPGGAFSADGRQLAFGYSLDGEAGGWDLIVINLDSFSLGGSLSSSDPLAAGLESNFGLTPTPLYFRPDGQIAFAMVRGGTDGSAAGYDAYLWHPVNGTLTPTVGYTDLGLEVYKPTGEVLLSGADDRFPATAGDALPFGQQNVLSYYSVSTGAVTPFYTDPAVTLYNPTFVMNGAHILISAYDGVATEEYRLIGRGGASFGALTISPAPYDVIGTHDGFFYAQSIGSSPAFFNVNLRDGAIDFNETESAILIGAESTSPRIVWVGDNDPASDYFSTEAYIAWGGIGAGVTDSAGSGSTGLSTVLQVGGQATIRTTDGDSLNVRGGAGTGFAVVAKAAPGSVVDLLDGPQAADGYVWWLVRLASGQEGWVVESAENEITLVPGAGSFVPPQTNQAANPSISSTLAIGDTAYVTLSGRIDALRLRNQPSLAGGVIQLMPNTTPVTVIGGPTSADGFTWWQVRAADGTVGWAAEVIGSERVLQKGSAPVAAATAVPNGGGVVTIQPTAIPPVTTPES